MSACEICTRGRICSAKRTELFSFFIVCMHRACVRANVCDSKEIFQLSNNTESRVIDTNTARNKKTSTCILLEETREEGYNY